MKFLKIAGKILLILVILIVLYALYVILTYHRIEDNLLLEIHPPVTQENSDDTVQLNTDYRIISYNIGFGAYSPDFTFFMDGGKSSVAKSRDSVIELVTGAAKTAQKENVDFAIFEEVDLDSTRSHHVNQIDLLSQSFADYYYQYSINYDSAFLMVPPWEPHGKSLSSLAFYSRFPITSAIRRSFPIASGFSKFLDLDRCYSVSRIPVSDGKELCIYSVHMSAYGNDASVREGQMKMLMEDMKTERALGNYIVCGGDFNHNMNKSAEEDDSTPSWAHPFPREYLPDSFVNVMDLLPEEVQQNMAKSSRNTDIPYDPKQSFVVTLDGFLISDNIVCKDFEILDTGFAYSDHNPVVMTFELIS
ncbi:MAG: endonuclease/exonuclease/phosphatase family protein [Eubacteriales bacterium]|nr:endonuclease/exonuclease/phosphatase family protein [Eubacteriales bacterium]